MKVILFIGHHKVGSTALQDFLARNQAALIRAGILYPSVDFEGMTMALAAATGTGTPPETLPINAREPHNALAFRMLAHAGKGKVPPFHEGLPALAQMKRAIGYQVDLLAPHTVILAGEVFSNFAPASPELISDLAEIFPGADLTVVATLRRIDEYLASWHGQRLKFGHKVAPLREDAMEGYLKGIHFDYRKMLGGWIDTLPEARFILRNYDGVRASGGSVADFVSQTGLELPPGLEAERKTNESLHRGLYEVARLGNQRLGPSQARELRRFLRRQTPYLDLPASQDIELFGAANRQEMLERFAPVQEYLGEVTGKPAFFTDLEDVAETRPIDEMDVFAQVLERLKDHRFAKADAAAQAFLSEIDT